MSAAPLGLFMLTDVEHRLEMLAQQPDERLRGIAVLLITEIGLMHRLVLSMALGLTRDEMPVDERYLLDLVLGAER